MNIRAGFIRNQNELVVTFTLVEFLTAMVFIAMALALILRNEAREEVLRDLNPSQERMRELRDTVAAQRDRIGRLTSENEALLRELADKDSLIRRLMANRNAALPPGETVVSRAYLNELRGDAAISGERAAIIRGLEEQIRALRGGATITLARCPTNTGDLLTVRLHGNGMLSARPAWRSEFAARVARVPGVAELSSGRQMSLSEFGRYADRAAQWGLAQDPRCRFRVSMETAHSNMAIYRRQRSTVWGGRFIVTEDRVVR